MLETDLLFVADISKLFRISENTIRRREWRKKSGIPLRKIGRQLCSSREELERWYKGLNA